MPPLFLGTVLLFLFALLSAALGHRLLLWLRGPQLSGAERGVWAMALGTGALSYLPFLLFTLGIGRPAGIRISVALLALLLAPDMKRVLQGGWRRLRSLGDWSRGRLLLFTLLTLLLLLLYMRALCPPIDGDAIDYHLTAPLRYLQTGHFRYLPTLVYTNWPLGVQMHYALLLGLHPDAPPAIVPFLFGLLLLASLYLLAERFMGRRAGIAALCLLVVVDNFSPHGIWFQMMSAMVDLGLTLYFTCAVFALYRSSVEREDQSAWLRLSALFGGLAATTKLTGVWGIVALTVTLLLTFRREGFRTAINRAVVFCLLAVCVAAPWFLKTWVLTGNPLYPMFTRQLGGIEWTPEGWARFQHAHLEWNTPSGKLPTPEVLQTVHTQTALLGLGLALLMVWLVRRSRYAPLLQTAALFCGCICVANYLHPRFLMPALPCALVCLAASLRDRRILAVLLCASAFVVFRAGRQQLLPTLPEAVRVALGQTSREAYLRSSVPEWEVIQFANHRLPESARVLLSGYDSRPAFYRAEALWPDYALQDSIHYDTPERLDADLQRLGVDYLVLNTGFPDWCETSHRCRERKQNELVPTILLAERRGTLLFQSNGYRLYALHF
jgi:hypothetical protein